MNTVSVLYKDPGDIRISSSKGVQECCVDLNLDQVFASIAASNRGYDLGNIFNETLTDIEEARYRQDIFRDIIDEELETIFFEFSRKMLSVKSMLESLSKIASKPHKNGSFLEATIQYCDGCENLATALADAAFRSEGLRKLGEYVKAYIASDAYIAFSSEARSVLKELGQIHFTTTVKNFTVTVRKYEEEPDYGKAIENTFSRFSQFEGRNYLVSYPATAGVNRVQAQVLIGVSKLWPEIFARLSAFCEAHEIFIDETLGTFAKDVQFYLSWLSFMRDLEAKGYDFCLPELQEGHEGSQARDLFDAALALKQEAKAVTNDFYLDEQEHIIVVTGPNQGGKTTFARAVGQLHYLAALGCPVPGSSAKLMLTDQIFTHFEREESIKTHHGKLFEELVHVRECLENATERSLLIINEAFSSTTIQDSLMLSERIIRKIIGLRVFSVWVTFLHELSDMHSSIVSMAGEIVRDNPSMRTFRITRKQADDLTYARALAEKHGLLYGQLEARMQR